MKEAKLYKKEGRKIRCLACAQKCLINNNQTGICGVRKHINGKLYLLVYGKIISANIDPIEKKPLYHFLPGSYAYSIGTVGCNFHCDFCQNYDISQFKEFFPDAIEKMSKQVEAEEIVKQALSSDCKSIAYTYTEPVISAEFVYDVAKLAKDKGLKNILVTNGYLSKESFDYLCQVIDAMNIDLKSFSDEFYKNICKASKGKQPVLDTIKRAYEAGIHIEITTLIIPDENDSKQVLREIAEFIASIDKEIPWHISRFFPAYKMTGKQLTSIEKLEEAKLIGEKAGLKNLYIGNV
ncbi:MAG: AmmeMemoRadiSam system radical SAM enzyme [Candidatus Nanoarchaeia archaeon]